VGSRQWAEKERIGRETLDGGFSLSLGERVARDPDALHRDAGRVRGRSCWPTENDHGGCNPEPVRSHSERSAESRSALK